MNRQANTIEQAALALLNGEPVVFPTDTVYGVGVAACAAGSPESLYAVKERAREKPIAWLVSSTDALERFGASVPDSAKMLAHAYWPGPLTIIVNAGEAVPPSFCSQTGTIGLRMPDNSVALRLVEAVGGAVATTSANIAGEEAPCRFEDLDPLICSRVSAVLADVDDEGKSGIASTVVDCTGDRPVVVRAGDVSLEDVEKAVSPAHVEGA